MFVRWIHVKIVHFHPFPIMLCSLQSVDPKKNAIVINDMVFQTFKFRIISGIPFSDVPI
jgi:hypothetical protein